MANGGGGEEAEERTFSSYEEREEKMVSVKDGKGTETIRLARFLKPFAQSVDQAIKVPNTPLLSEIFSENITQQWSSKVNFRGWLRPLKEWGEWVDKLAVKHGKIWKKTKIYEPIVNSTYNINRNRSLILGLVEFWCSETNTFVFPWGEVTITLEDIMILGGFSISGSPINCPVKGYAVEMVEAMNITRKGMYRFTLFG